MEAKGGASGLFDAGAVTMVDPSAGCRRTRASSQRCLLALLSLIGVFHGEAQAASRIGEILQAGSNLVGLAILVALVPAFVYFVRWHSLRRLQTLMMAKSQEAGPGDAEPAGAQAATLVEPGLTVFDDLGQLPGAVEARELFVRRAVSVFRKALAVDALAALGYAALPFLVDAVLGANGGQTDGAQLGVVLGALYLLLAAIRYLLFRTQFRAIDERSRLERMVMLVINLLLMFVPINVHPMTLLEHLLSPRVYALYLAGWICLMIGMGLDQQVPGLILAALVHIGLALWFARSLQRIPGKRLVVLRVFGLDKNAQFLFDGVLAFWKHFGHFFTVVDPAYWRHSNRVLSLGTLAVMALAILSIVFGFLVFSMLPGALHEDFAPLAAAVFSLPVLWGYSKFSDRHVDHTFIRSKAHLEELLAHFEKRPRNFDMTYRSLETRCYDNTWKIAVAEFTRQADVVVMDLRGYSTEREGCKYEVNYLLDVVPVERIVFLLDEQSNHESVGALVLEAWKELRATSPNLAKDAPQIRFYVAATKDARDIQGVIDLLINAAAVERPATA